MRALMTLLSRRLMPLLTSVALLGSRALGAAPEVPTAEGTRRALERLGQLRIFFGHQSVGDDILEGVRDLAKGVAPPPVAVAELAPGGALARGVITHARIGRNEDPVSKVEHFERLLTEGVGASADVALFKLCYVDFNASTDTAALFARYQAAHEALRAKFPHIRWVHVTAPLTVVQRGVKGWLKERLGRTPFGAAENARRHEYNERLRRAYGAREPLFDLAQLEATRPDGSLETYPLPGGGQAPALVPAYARDGEHLNEDGRRRVALALVELLAALPPPEAREPAGPPPGGSAPQGTP